MNTFTQTGDIISLIAPAGGVVSGQGFIAGSFFAIANTTEAAGDAVEGMLVGVFNMPAKVADVFAPGDKVYWDATNKYCTVTVTSNKLIGVATSAVAGGSVHVRLNGVGLA